MKVLLQNKNLIMYNDTIKKVHLNRLFVFLLVLLGAVLMCGCSTGETGDEIVMELLEETNLEETNLEETDLEETKQESATQTANAEVQPLCIYICGAVINPGVYQLEHGSRLYEAVEMAGGLSEEADMTALNLARQVSDGEQIVILTCEETDKLRQEGKYTFEQGAVNTQGNASSGLVNINTASVSELTTVSGIGEARAQAIIAYREKNGSFRCIEDIKKVEGIKDGLFSKIKDKITV